MEQPTGRKDLLTKLGLLEYMSDHLPGLSETITCFADIRKEWAPFHWQRKHTEA